MWKYKKPRLNFCMNGDIAEKRFREFKNNEIETDQNETWREKWIFFKWLHQWAKRKLWMESFSGGQGTEKIFEEIMGKFFQICWKYQLTDPKSSMNPEYLKKKMKKTVSRYIMFKLLKVDNKEKNLEIRQRKKEI